MPRTSCLGAEPPRVSGPDRVGPLVRGRMPAQPFGPVLRAADIRPSGESPPASARDRLRRRRRHRVYGQNPAESHAGTADSLRTALRVGARRPSTRPRATRMPVRRTRAGADGSAWRRATAEQPRGRAAGCGGRTQPARGPVITRATSPSGSEPLPVIVSWKSRSAATGTSAGATPRNPRASSQSRRIRRISRQPVR